MIKQAFAEKFLANQFTNFTRTIDICIDISKLNSRDIQLYIRDYDTINKYSFFRTQKYG